MNDITEHYREMRHAKQSLAADSREAAVNAIKKES